MTAITTSSSQPGQRLQGKRRVTPSKTGTPDPRPVTSYSAALSTVSGKSRLTITLAQPCVIRQPSWPVIDCTAGTLVYPVSVTAVNNTTFYFDFGGLVTTMAAFVQVPYQDMEVQNFQGGYVSPGGQWFREPTSP